MSDKRTAGWILIGVGVCLFFWYLVGNYLFQRHINSLGLHIGWGGPFLEFDDLWYLRNEFPLIAKSLITCLFCGFVFIMAGGKYLEK
jgi:hypothetical protein